MRCSCLFIGLSLLLYLLIDLSLLSKTTSARTGKPTRLSFEILEGLADRITKDVPGVVSVTYNITKKPPSTIEAV